MKRVIFVGGTSYSGSTFFNMVLANDSRGLAIGAVQNLFWPTKPYHFHMHCTCGEQPGEMWEKVKAAGEDALYPTLFEMFPDIDVIVESSKDPIWINNQTKSLEANGIAAQNIVMWKTPYELAHSFQKRGDVDAWKSEWEVYHRMYYTLIPEWKSVSYRDFTNSGLARSNVYRYLSLPEFPGKEHYWERDQHVLGGNPSARVHLYSTDDEKYLENVNRSNSRIDVVEKGVHQSVHYSIGDDEALQSRVAEQINASPTLQSLLELLESRDVGLASDHEEMPEFPELIMPSWMIQVRRAKQWGDHKRAVLVHRTAGESLPVLL